MSQLVSQLFPASQGTATVVGVAAVANDGPDILDVACVELSGLFPASQITAAHRANKSQTVLQLLDVPGNNTKFARRLNDAVAQLFNGTARLHKRLAVEDDDFFRLDKVQRLEQMRQCWRQGTRLFDPPSRKKPLSTLMHPTCFASDKHYAVRISDKPSTSVEGLLNEPVRNTFPGSVPQSLMRSDIPKLYDGAYFFVWAPKTNGLRFFATFCHFGNEPWLALINRSQQIFFIPNVTAPDVMFDGTLFDGELVPTKSGGFRYVAYECAMSCGVPCSEYNYLVRLQIASINIECWQATHRRPSHDSLMSDGKFESMTLDEATQAHWKGVMQESKGISSAKQFGNVARCDLQWSVKRVYSPDRFYEMLTLDLPTLDHDTDGFIPTAVEPPIQIGQTSTIFKVKRATDHTIDFLAIVLPNPNDIDAPVLVDLVAVNNRGVSQMEAGVLWDTIQIAKNDLPGIAQRLGYLGPDPLKNIDKWLHGKIVECRYNAERKTWDPEIIRHDKSTPNKISTAEKTWKNITESLRLQDIFPPGSIPDAQRQLLIDWEQKHPDWKPQPSKPNPITTTDSKTLGVNQVPQQTIVTVPTSMAPSPLSRLITFN